MPAGARRARSLRSFKPANTLYDADPLPTRPTLANYRVAITGFPIGQLIANTFAVAVGVMILQLAVAVLAAYAIVRFRTRADGLLLLAGTAAILVRRRPCSSRSS